jgi:hypothetical protein
LAPRVICFKITDDFPTFLRKFIVSSNHAAAVYRLKTVANDGTHHLDKVSVLLSFKNNKLNYWREVSAHIKYPKHQLQR